VNFLRLTTLRSAAAGMVAQLLALLLAACASSPKPPPPEPPTQVTGTISASTQLNPNIAKRASPLLVRIYQLKSPTAFNASDFVSLYQRDQAELGGDLVAREEFMLMPGETRAWDRVLGPDVKCIAVFGAYRDLEHASWRSVVEVQPHRKQALTVRADDLDIKAVIPTEKPR
jgi:type VI secretion system protein VasD